jgi:predicted transcriptional regulator
MAISNELSSEIAAAILAEKKTPQELRQLKDVILRVHSALQEMSEEVRETRWKAKAASERRGFNSPDSTRR